MSNTSLMGLVALSVIAELLAQTCILGHVLGISFGTSVPSPCSAILFGLQGSSAWLTACQLVQQGTAALLVSVSLFFGVVVHYSLETTRCAEIAPQHTHR